MNEARYRAAEQRLWESIGVRPTEHMLRLERNSGTVRVQTLGRGPAVLFVHGGNTSGCSWATLAARLTGFRCILLDRPGTGLSQPLGAGLDLEGVVRFAETLVVDVLDALRLESAHLVATSFGGFIALRTAAAHPERIGRVVEFSWPVGAPISRLPASLRIMSIPGLGRAIAALPASERTVRAILRSAGHGPSLDAGRITAEDLACYLALLRNTDTLRNDVALGRILISPLRGFDPLLLPSSLLARIQTPTCFVWGENDPFGGAEFARRVVESMPHAELELMPGAGHAPWLDDLQRCAELTGSYLSRRSR